MRIEQGHIFRPETSNNIQYSVRLEITDSLIELEFSDDSFAPKDFGKVEIILGVFNGLGKITFLDCSLSGTATGGGANIKKYRVEYLLQGVHIYSWQELKFSKCIANIPSLFDWVNIRPITNKLWTEKKLYCEHPKEIKLASFDKFELLFSFEYHTSIEKNEIHLKQYTNLKIVAKNNFLFLNEFFEILTHFKKFMLFIINKSPISETITLFNDKYTRLSLL
ncbi:MAG: hypothetical protein CVT99_11045 [Bacteroidetes bacterium HGW-Bacteroidetes-16]|jgi:hypothetical protein|nr:MAG: hypothetical protein CVT99_11045 [Bacteroidetes bacterium HGW-Bacteroidetes-16]